MWSDFSLEKIHLFIYFKDRVVVVVERKRIFLPLVCSSVATAARTEPG